MRPGMIIIAAVTAIAAVIAFTATYLLVTAVPAGAQEGTAAAAQILDPSILNWGFASAAVSAGLSAAAAGYAVGQVGSAAVGALAEKPELMGRVLVVVGLAEGIAIYGLIVAILILNRLG